jgi:hypothetical protein
MKTPELKTVEVLNVKFDVYYTKEITKDPLATGDSPTEVEFEIVGIELTSDCTDLREFLNDYTVNQITKQLD